ncbi:MAG: dTDP-4-dehydrorhamnose reductase, partial [Gammaproteobacteria bacterium]|nr:dTDP-4-dehydrorhamnose reductase [Gammaproteobacteria bacterium]
MNKRVLVTGANGQLGRSIQNSAPDYVELEFTFVTRDELDLSRTKFIDDYFQDKEYDVVINCAAYTAVDKAEEESALAEQINHFAVKRLAEICKVTNTSFVHISTDYVFDGKSYRPYIETDVPNPENIYGKTKLAGELAVQEINPNGLIIRTSWVYSEYGSNFVKTMLRLGETKNSLSVVYDQIGSPTYARDLAEAILSIIQRNRLDAEEDGIGVYHYSNEVL